MPLVLTGRPIQTSTKSSCRLILNCKIFVETILLWKKTLLSQVLSIGFWEILDWGLQHFINFRRKAAFATRQWTIHTLHLNAWNQDCFVSGLFCSLWFLILLYLWLYVIGGYQLRRNNYFVWRTRSRKGITVQLVGEKKTISFFYPSVCSCWYFNICTSTIVQMKLEIILRQVWNHNQHCFLRCKWNRNRSCIEYIENK